MSITSLRCGSSTAWKLFLTCWLIYALHFATDIVREHYLAFSLAEDQSFRMDKYLGLHVDVFETPGRGAHIGNNPGVSMVAAIPYWLARPVIRRIVDRVNARRSASGAPLTAIYDEPRETRVEFYRLTRERGLDIQFGLAAGVIHLLLMAPVSAFAALVMWRLLGALGYGDRGALLGALLYAFGTPVFFRTGYLNQNLLIAQCVLCAFVVLWRPHGWLAWTDERACVVAGGLCGFCLLADYSGAIVLACLGLYGMAVTYDRGGWPAAVRGAAWFTAGALPPIALLLFYQWRSFGSPWFPGQHYMPPVEWIDIGYRGVGLPTTELFGLLLFDPRYGLFITCPVLLLSLVGAIQGWRGRLVVPRRETVALFGFALALVMFFSAVQYTRLQWVTGIRYVVPAIPALFLLTWPILRRLPAWAAFVIIVLAFAQAWCLAMTRAIFVVDSIAQVFLGGFQLPWMNVLARMAPQYFPFMADRVSPLPLFALSGILLYALWTRPAVRRWP